VTDIVTPIDRENEIVTVWLDALTRAYLLAKARRLTEMQGRRYRKYDEEGLEGRSAEWGRVYAMEELMPELQQVRNTGGEFCTPSVLRRASNIDAEIEFSVNALQNATTNAPLAIRQGVEDAVKAMRQEAGL
jgi:hypothetical protein